MLRAYDSILWMAPLLAMHLTGCLLEDLQLEDVLKEQGTVQEDL
jgi:hypothetical protein